MSKFKTMIGLLLVLSQQSFAAQRPNVWVEQIRKWKLQEAFTCRVYRDSGNSQGQIMFQRQFPSCAHIYLTSQWFSSFFGLSAQQSLSRDRMCYEMGYKIGFLTAYDNLWSSCHEELADTIQKENDEALLQCRELAGVISKDREKETSSLATISAMEPDLANELATMIVLLNRGDYQDSWKKIVDLHASSQKGLIPCEALIGAEISK